MATAAGLIFGTARYISPEGAQGETVGPAGDVYAMATLLYQMLAGRTPFEGEQAVALLVQQIHDAPPPIRSIPAAAGVPEAIASVIMKNLSKTPADRSPDARAFGRALVEAARTVGFSAEDSVPRSNLFGSQARRSVPSVTVGTPASAEGAPRTGAPADLPAPDPSVTPGPAAPVLPGMKTRKWAPPESSDVVAPQRPSPPRAGAPADATPPPAGYRSNIDPTLDDSNPLKLPPSPSPALPASPVRTEPGFPSPAAHHMVAPPLQLAPAPVPRTQPLVVSPTAQASPGIARPLDNAIPDAQRPLPARRPGRRASRLPGVLFACLLIGAVGASAGLYQLGWFRPAPHAGSLGDAVTRADDALKHGRWDTPPGDNVRDITTQALARWPRDPRLLDLRARATGELVKEAVGRKFAGDLPAALHLARLANELDPTDTTAQHLVEEYERAAKEETVDLAPVALPPTSPGSSPRHGASSRTPVVARDVAKVAIESSLPHPRIGQPVTFTARVSIAAGSPKAIEDARFVINGPGLVPDTRLGTLTDAAATYSATFAGFEPGKYEVTFDAKVDGTPVRAIRTLVIEGVAPAPAASATATAASSSARPLHHSPERQVAVTMRACDLHRTVSLLASVALASLAATARGDDDPRWTEALDRGLISRPHTIAELEAGAIVLPSAPISPAQRGGNLPAGLESARGTPPSRSASMSSSAPRPPGLSARASYSLRDRRATPVTASAGPAVCLAPTRATTSSSAARGATYRCTTSSSRAGSAPGRRHRHRGLLHDEQRRRLLPHAGHSPGQRAHGGALGRRTGRSQLLVQRELRRRVHAARRRVDSAVDASVLDHRRLRDADQLGHRVRGGLPLRLSPPALSPPPILIASRAPRRPRGPRSSC